MTPGKATGSASTAGPGISTFAAETGGLRPGSRLEWCRLVLLRELCELPEVEPEDEVECHPEDL